MANAEDFIPWIWIVAGLLLYAVLFYAHPLVTGWPVMLP